MISGQITSTPRRSGLVLRSRSSFRARSSCPTEVSGEGKCSTRIPVSRTKRSVSPVSLAREGTDVYWSPLFPAISGKTSRCDHSGSRNPIVTGSGFERRQANRKRRRKKLKIKQEILPKRAVGSVRPGKRSPILAIEPSNRSPGFCDGVPTMNGSSPGSIIFDPSQTRV